MLLERSNETGTPSQLSSESNGSYSNSQSSITENSEEESDDLVSLIDKEQAAELIRVETNRLEEKIQTIELDLQT